MAKEFTAACSEIRKVVMDCGVDGETQIEIRNDGYAVVIFNPNFSYCDELHKIIGVALDSMLETKDFGPAKTGKMANYAIALTVEKDGKLEDSLAYMKMPLSATR